MIFRGLLVVLFVSFVSPLAHGWSGEKDYSFHEQTVKACSGVDRSPEACYWWEIHKKSQCGAGKKCENLVIYFSGGDQGCAIPGQVDLNIIYGQLGRKFADRGFVFVCANLFEEIASPWAGKMPYGEESERVGELVSSITKHENVLRHWTGNRLLFSGVSHGATAPVLAIRKLKKGTLPMGKETTGACFMDGQYDAYYNQTFWASAGEQCDWFYNRTICTRYFGESYCDYPQFSTDITQDSLVRTYGRRQPSEASDFSVKHWKLVSCGSLLKNRCGLEPGVSTGSLMGDLLAQRADMMPAPPIRELCRLIDGGAQHSCQYQALPLRSHVDCGLAGVADVQCIDWFQSIR